MNSIAINKNVIFRNCIFILFTLLYLKVNKNIDKLFY